MTIQKRMLCFCIFFLHIAQSRGFLLGENPTFSPGSDVIGTAVIMSAECAMHHKSDLVKLVEELAVLGKTNQIIIVVPSENEQVGKVSSLLTRLYTAPFAPGYFENNIQVVSEHPPGMLDGRVGCEAEDFECEWDSVPGVKNHVVGAGNWKLRNRAQLEPKRTTATWTGRELTFDIFRDKYASALSCKLTRTEICYLKKGNYYDGDHSLSGPFEIMKTAIETAMKEPLVQKRVEEYKTGKEKQKADLELELKKKKAVTVETPMTPFEKDCGSRNEADIIQILNKWKDHNATATIDGILRECSKMDNDPKCDDHECLYAWRWGRDSFWHRHGKEHYLGK